MELYYMSENEIAVVEESTTPSLSNQFDIVDVEAAEAFMNNYQDLVKALLDVEEDYQDGKKKKSAWRKLATAFNISDEIVNEQLIFDDVDGQIITARYKVKAILPNGRSTIGVGVCSIYDKIRYTATKKYDADKETPSNFELRGRFSNAEHDVPSTAHTRAKNRAISDLIGAGETSAEELEKEVKVTRNSRGNNGSSTKSVKDSVEDKPKTSRSRGRSRRSKKVEPEVQEAEVIETQAEVVQETTKTATSSSGKDYKSVDNELIQKAISRIEDADEEVTLSSINDELFNLYTIGQCDLDQFDEAKKALGIMN